MIRKLLACVVLASVALAAHAQQAPFIPLGNAAPLTLTGSAQTITLPRISNPGPLYQYVITSYASPISGCTQPTFFTTDGTTATTSNGQVVLPNAAYVFSFPSALTSISVIGADVGCIVHVEVGVGQ